MRQLVVCLTIGLGGFGWVGGAPALAGAGRTDPCATREVTRDVAYVDDPVSRLQRLDVQGFDAGDGCEPAPVVVYVHGGGWRVGDKRAVHEKAAFFNELGAVFVSVNYRLSSARGGSAQHPDHAGDVGAAVAWLQDHIAGHGGDGARLALLGHSAGAHLVALVGLDPTYVEQAGGDIDHVRCVLSDDTEAYDLVRRAGDRRSRRLITLAFGDDEAVWHDASPVHHVSDREEPPDFLVVRRGALRRRAAQTDFGRAVREAGAEVTFLDATGLTHAEVNRLIGDPDDDVVTPVVDSFTRDCLA